MRDHVEREGHLEEKGGTPVLSQHLYPKHMSEAILRLRAPVDLPQTTPCGPEVNHPQ